MTPASKVRGTQDKLNLSKQNKLIDFLKSHLSLYNFTPVEMPILEKTELFTGSLGEQTDVVTKQIFKIEKQGSENICLRPEGTAGTTRAFLENKNEINLPWKTFSFGPMFRYERPQKGRWRQFDQFNIEVIGKKSVFHDIELILMLDNFFQNNLELYNYSLKINYLGNNSDRENFREKLKSFLKENESSICQICNQRKDTNPLRCLDCKVEECKKVYKNAPIITQSLCKESLEEFEIIKNNLEFNSVNFTHDTQLVRGLDYYQGIVFEFSSELLGAQDAFCGGGNYELAKKMGSKTEYISCGAGIGTDRLLLLLEESNKIEILEDNKDYLCAILPISKEQNPLAIQVSDFLRRNKIKTQTIFDKKNLKDQLSFAFKTNSDFAVIIGEEEMKTNKLNLKNMATKEAVLVEQSKVLSKIKEWIEN